MAVPSVLVRVSTGPLPVVFPRAAHRRPRWSPRCTRHDGAAPQNSSTGERPSVTLAEDCPSAPVDVPEPGRPATSAGVASGLRAQSGSTTNDVFTGPPQLGGPMDPRRRAYSDGRSDALCVNYRQPFRVAGSPGGATHDQGPHR